MLGLAKEPNILGTVYKDPKRHELVCINHAPMDSYSGPFQRAGGYSNHGQSLGNLAEYPQETACVKARCGVDHPYQESEVVQGDGKRPSSPGQSAFHFQATAFQSGYCGWTYFTVHQCIVTCSALGSEHMFPT